MRLLHRQTRAAFQSEPAIPLIDFRPVHLLALHGGLVLGDLIREASLIRLFLLSLVIACCGFTYLIGNGRVALWDRDEPRYAETSRQMLQTGDYVVPRLLDNVRTAKPAMIYWLQAGAMKLFGDNEFAARFPSAMAMIVLLVILAAVLWKPLGPDLALTTVFVFGTSGLVIASAKMCITDAVLLVWVTMGQFCLYAIYRNRGTWSVIMTLAIAIGLAGLTKGPVILGMQAMTVVILVIIRLADKAIARYGIKAIETGSEAFRPATADRKDGLGRAGSDPVYLPIVDYQSPSSQQPENFEFRLSFTAVLKTIAVFAVVLAIVSPWVLMVNYRASGFLFASLKHDVWDRMMTPLEQHVGPPGYYLLTIWVTFFPWSLFLPLAIGLAWHRRGDPRARFALAAVIGPWIMLECVRTKLPHYLLPAFPPLAFLTADALLRVIRRQIDDLRNKPFVVVIGIWASLVVAAGLAPWLVWKSRDLSPLPVAGMVTVSAFSALFGLAVFVSFARRRILAALVILGSGTLLFFSIAYTVYLPDAQFLRVSNRLAAILKENHVTQKGQVKMFEYMEPSLAFAQGGTIREAGDLGFTPGFANRLPPWLVITQAAFDKAPLSLRQQFEIVGDVFGLAYADKGKWEHVLVIHRKS